MTVCKFYQQGNCKFGDRCRFEHPSRNQPQSNRFGALGSGASRGNNASLDKYRLDFDNIEKDLTSEVPQWILSAYGPGREAPRQLFGGYPREQSFEEMRLHFLEGKASGNEQAALNQAQELYLDAQKQMQNAVRNLNDAVQYVVSAENEHPNRHDICREGTQGAPFGEFLVEKRRGPFASNAPAASNPFSTNSTPAAPSAFGAAAPQTSAFGQPSAMGAKPNPFATGTSAFGQPAQASQGSAFGQAPQTQGSAFGQPSTLGAKPNPFGTPAFGQAASATPGGAFGQPSQTQGSAFGQAAQTQGSAFGQPSQMGAKPNPFAANTSTASPFSSIGNNTASANETAGPFGQNQAKPNPFASPSSNNNASKPNPFASPSSNNNAAKPNPFAASSTNNNTTASPFSQPAQQKPNPFAATSQPTAGAANPFASATNQNNAFAQARGDSMQNAPPSVQPNTASPFAQAGQTGNAFGQPSAANPFASGPANQRAGTAVQAVQGAGPYPPGSSKQHPDGYITRDGFGNLSTFKGQRVIQKDGKPGVNIGGQFVKIWFPDGPPGYNKDTALPMEDYDPETLERWKAFEGTGQFEDGIMPELPPPREVTTWDF